MRFPAEPHDGGRWNRFDHDPWIEHYLARRQSASRFPAVARLWVPVIVSFLVQVPAVFLVWHPAVRHLVLARPGGGELLLALLVALVGPLALIGARRFPGPVVAIGALVVGVPSAFLGLRSARLGGWLLVGAGLAPVVEIVGRILQGGESGGLHLGGSSGAAAMPLLLLGLLFLVAAATGRRGSREPGREPLTLREGRSGSPSART